MSIVLVATIIPADGCRDEVIAAFEQVIPAVHASDGGCELYALHEDEDRLIMIEKWASPEALEAHARSAALAQLGAAIDGKTVGGVDVKTLTPHPVGTAAQGQL